MNSNINKSKSRETVVAVTVFAVSLLISACSSSTQSEQSSGSSISSVTKVSQSDFNDAGKSFEIQVDEFDGSTLMGPTPPSDIMDTGVKQGSEYAYMAFGFEKMDDASDFATNLIVSYSGEEWLFFDSIDIKSSLGTFYFELDDSGQKTEDVGDDARVTEIAVQPLSPSQVQDLSLVIGGADLKFRLNGSGDKAGENFTGNFSKWMEKIFIDGAKLSIGFAQGLKLNE